MSPLPQPLLRVPAKGELLSIQERLIAGRQKCIEHIISTVRLDEATFDNAYAPLLRYDDHICDEDNMNMVLKFASTDAEVQTEAEEGIKLWDAHWSWQLSQDKFIRRVMAAGERTDGLDPESKRRLQRSIEWYTRLGFGKLDDATRKAYLDTRSQVSDLCEEFNRNIRLYDGGQLLYTDAELRGLDQSDIDQYEKDADGKRCVPLKRAEYTKIMRSATDYNMRKALDAAWSARLPENVAIFRKTILLRHENAQRIGFKSDADSCLYSRMAKSTEWVEALLADLTSHLLEPGRKLFTEVEALKQRLVDEKSAAVDLDGPISVQSWERSYLEKLQAKQNSIDQKAISAYLPFKETSAAILRNLAKYLQLRLEPVAKEDLEGCIWSDDVDVWAVWDEGEEEKGQFVGYLYGDLLDRPNKYKHNQTVEVQPSYLREDGSRPYPAVILMCSFSPDVVDGCKVLQQGNIVTMYHEMGHAFQVLFSRTKWSDSHGYRVALELGEGIGTVMENYAWIKEELQSISCHYVYTGDAYKQAWMERNPGEPLPPRELPAELISELINRRPRRRIETYLAQFSDAIFDMTVHNPKTYEDLVKMDETKVYRDLIEKFCFVADPEPSYPQAAFSHLMSGYNSGYYAYVCSNVFGEEIFQSNFAADPTSAEAWKRFRRELLQFGGSRDPTDLLEEFLGRTPSSAALLKSLGIE